MKSGVFRPVDIAILLVVGASGLLGLLAYSDADLVAWSSFLVLPFLLLFPAPTVALYSGLFAIGYFLFFRWNRLGAAVIAFGLVVVVTIGVPALINRRLAAEQVALSAGDRSAPPVAPGRVFAILRSGKWGGVAATTSCDELCRALLFSGRSSAVVMASSARIEDPTPAATRWTIERGAAPCVSPFGSDDDRPFFRSVDLGDGDIRDHGLVGECLRGRPASLAEADLILAVAEYRDGAKDDRRTPALSRPVGGTQLTVWRRAADGSRHLVSRRSWPESTKLPVPFYFSLAGSPNSGAYWVWSRSGLRPYPSPIRAVIDLNNMSVPRVTPALVRAAIDRWLDHPGLAGNDLGQRFTSAAINLMAPGQSEAGDAVRIARMIRDPRVPPGLVRRAVAALPGRTSAFRDALLERIAAAPDSADALHYWNYDLDDFPPGAFADAGPALLKLVADPQRRAHLPNAIVRLADGGPAAADSLFALLEAPPAMVHFNDALLSEDHASRDAALEGLCRLGRTIPPAYRRVEAALDEQRETVNGRVIAPSSNWAAVHIRLGRPIGSIAPPNDATADSFWRNVHQLVASADCSAR